MLEYLLLCTSNSSVIHATSCWERVESKAGDFSVLLPAKLEKNIRQRATKSWSFCLIFYNDIARNFIWLVISPLYKAWKYWKSNIWSRLWLILPYFYNEIPRKLICQNILHKFWQEGRREHSETQSNPIQPNLRSEEPQQFLTPERKMYLFN